MFWQLVLTKYFVFRFVDTAISNLGELLQAGFIKITLAFQPATLNQRNDIILFTLAPLKYMLYCLNYFA